MGDGMTNTPWDVFMYFLVFGGVPFLVVVVPLIVFPLVYRVTKRWLFGRITHRPTDEGLDDSQA